LFDAGTGLTRRPGAVRALAKRRRRPHCQAPWPTMPTISCASVCTIRA
jgi:hypothetical protein